MQKMKNKGTIFSIILPLFFLLGGYVYDIRYLLRYGRILLDSDMASEMVLSELLNKSHSLLTTDWIYSTELRVFGVQLFFRLGLFLFPNNWLLARTIGTALMLALLAGSIFLATYAAGWKHFSIWAAAFAMWPLGFWYCFQSTFGAFYLPYAIFSFLSLFCVLNIVHATSKKKLFLYYLLLGLFSVGSGLNGVRQLMVFFAPLLLSSLFLFINKKRKYLLPSIYAFLLNITGYLFNMLYLANRYQFSTQDHYIWNNGTGSWATSLKWFFESFGYHQVSDMMNNKNYTGIPLFSFEGIAAGCGLVLGYAILASFLYLILQFKKLKEEDQLITSLCISMLVVIGFVFTHLFGARQYWQQTMAFGFVILVLCMKCLPFDSTLPKEAILLGLSILTIISARGTVRTSLEWPLRGNPNLLTAVEWLENNTDYQVGVASFWESNVVTELTNGNIDMYTVTNEWIPIIPNQWLQKTEHIEQLPQNDYFILCSYRAETTSNEYLETQLHANCIYDDGVYCIFAVE